MSKSRLRRHFIGTWSWKRPFYTLAFVYCSLLLVLVFFGDKLIFQPPRPDPDQPFTLIEGPDSKKISIAYQAPKSGYPVLLWSHGNAEDLSTATRLMREFQRFGFGTLAYDYPGYGHSEGSPTEASCKKTAEVVYQYLVEQLGHSADQIVLCGQSVGSGPTTWLASQKEHRALILISPFMSTFRTVTRIPLFPNDRFLNYKHIAKVDTPLLIVHGEKDKVIPYSEGRKLYERSPAKNKKFVSLPKAGHNDLYFLYLGEIMEEIVVFLELKNR